MDTARGRTVDAGREKRVLGALQSELLEDPGTVVIDRLDLSDGEVRRFVSANDDGAEEKSMELTPEKVLKKRSPRPNASRLRCPLDWKSCFNSVQYESPARTRASDSA